MAMTAGIVSGHAIGIYIGGTRIAACMAQNLDLGKNFSPANNADSGDSEVNLPRRKNWSVSGRSHFEFDAGLGWLDLFDAWDNDTQLTVLIGNDNVGDFEYSGSGYIESLKATFPDHENAEYDFVIKGDGDLTEAEITT